MNCWGDGVIVICSSLSYLLHRFAHISTIRGLYYTHTQSCASECAHSSPSCHMHMNMTSANIQHVEEWVALPALYDASTEGEDSTRVLTGTIMLGRMKNHTETIIRPTVVLWLWDQGGEEAKWMRLLTKIVELYLPTKLNTNTSHCSCKPTETDGFRQKHMRGCRRYDQWFNDDDGIAMIMIEFDQYKVS